jgi:hypothetical protein
VDFETACICISVSGYNVTTILDMLLIPYYALLCAAINKGDVKDTEIESIMDCIVDSLFSVFVTLGKFLFSKLIITS